MTLVGVLKVMTIFAVGMVFAQLNIANYETRKNVGEFLVLMGALGMVKKMISRSLHPDCIP